MRIRTYLSQLTHIFFIASLVQPCIERRLNWVEIKKKLNFGVIGVVERGTNHWFIYLRIHCITCILQITQALKNENENIFNLLYVIRDCFLFLILQLFQNFLSQVFIQTHYHLLYRWIKYGWILVRIKSIHPKNTVIFCLNSKLCWFRNLKLPSQWFYRSLNTPLPFVIFVSSKKKKFAFFLIIEFYYILSFKDFFICVYFSIIIFLFLLLFRFDYVSQFHRI